MVDNDLDYWKRREARMNAEARDAQNRAISANKAEVNKKDLERAAAAGQGKAAKTKENAMSWKARKAQEAARNKQRENALSEAARRDSKVTKKEALKNAISKFKGGKGGRMGGISGGGGPMPWDVR